MNEEECLLPPAPLPADAARRWLPLGHELRSGTHGLEAELLNGVPWTPPLPHLEIG